MSGDGTRNPQVELEFTEYPHEEMVRRSREFYRLLDRRRTVRHFCERDVPPEVVHNAILAAGTAPSGAHKQPWHFVIVKDPALKAEIRRQAEIEERESYERRMPQSWLDDLEPLGTDWNKPFLTTCPYLVAVFASLYGLGEGGEKSKHYYVQESVGIAVGMLLTALHFAGVATLTHTPSPMGFLHRILKRPDNERAYMLVGLGYPERGCRVPDLQRRTLEDLVTEF
jgi:nitroreductase